MIWYSHIEIYWSQVDFNKYFGLLWHLYSTRYWSTLVDLYGRVCCNDWHYNRSFREICHSDSYLYQNCSSAEPDDPFNTLNLLGYRKNNTQQVIAMFRPRKLHADPLASRGHVFQLLWVYTNPFDSSVSRCWGHKDGSLVLLGMPAPMLEILHRFFNLPGLI